MIDADQRTDDGGRLALVHSAFVTHAATRPDAPAVVAADATLTYRELDEQSNRLAHRLIELGAEPDARVAICMDRASAMYVALFGVLKSGACYIPIDPSFPPLRVQAMLDDGAPLAVICDGAAAQWLPADLPQVRIDDDAAPWRCRSASAPLIATRPEHLAYIIFTSGSTGRPKGVQVEHRNVVNLMTSMAAEPGFGPDDVFAAITTVSFDMAVPELFLALSAGGAVQLLTRDVVVDAFELVRALERTRPTMLQATPATYQMLLAAGWSGIDGLTALCGGEAMPRALANQLLELGIDLWNMYGPTETTVWSSLHHVEPGDEPVPLGHAVLDTQLYVLDAELRPVAPGELGELVIGGRGVARGYAGRPALTAEKFIDDQLGPVGGRRLYRTGDLARLRIDGSLEFLGRNDHQVKLRGYRIELADIEAALVAYDGVALAAVVLRETPAGDPYLAGFYSAARGELAPDSRSVRAHLRAAMPEYMVPAHLVPLDEMPLTPSSKVDRQGLPVIDMAAQRTGAQAVAARDELERRLIDAWEQVLGVPGLGIDDEFFDLGGNSLLAVRLFSQLESEVSVSLALSDLMEASTVASLATLITARAGGEDDYSPTVTIQSGDRAVLAPLFVVHGAGGNVVGFTETARGLPDDLPIVGIQARGVDGLAEPHNSIEAMVDEYLESVIADWDGPYRIAGYSAGGVVALEMARQLSARGREVEMVALIDTLPPSAVSRPLGVVDQFRRLLNEGPVGLYRSRAQDRKRAKQLATAARLAADYQPGIDRLPHALREARLVEAFKRATTAYEVTPYDGRVNYLAASEVWPVYDHIDSVGFWTDQCAELVVRQVPGDHFTLVEPPNAARLAAALLASIQRSASAADA